ncbi:MAG: peptidoglycan DD-metalloendopeptidase family protein [candidate division WOR-3 bacterium]|nr:MAG: peptidoglycan DD-metalloendopeptidase family protein [candidate division WOR-3 bacterium]
MTPLLTCLLVSGTLTLGQIESQIQQRRLELEQTGERLAEVRARIAQLDKSEATSLAKLEAYQQRIATTRRYIRQLNDQVAARSAEIAQVSAEAERTAKRIRELKEELRRRLVSIYKYGQILPLEAVFATSTVPDLSRKLRYFRFMARSEKLNAEKLKALQKELAAQQARLVAAKAELERLREEREREEASLVESKAAEDALLLRLRDERENKQKLEAELDESIGNLQALVTELERQRDEKLIAADSHHFVINKGRLPWPARGSIIASFGSQEHPRYKTRTNNRGIDIQTSTGTKVAAIADGRVSYADHFMGYGKLVILDHDGFYTLYANLDEIQATVGAVLKTGAAVGTSKDYLHFEIRREGRPVNPAEWLEP